VPWLTLLFVSKSWLMSIKILWMSRRRKFSFAFLIIPWSDGCISEVQLGGRNLNFVCSRRMSTKREGQLSTRSNIYLFSLPVIRPVFNSHSLNVSLVIQAFLLAL
jgi:hypothetical protein